MNIDVAAEDVTVNEQLKLVQPDVDGTVELEAGDKVHVWSPPPLT